MVVIMTLYDKIQQNKTYFIAEMSSNHGGKLEQALEIVHAAKKAGADCLKIQTYTADTMTLNCDNSYFQIQDGLWDGNTLYQLYQKAYTPWEWHEAIQKECERAGIDFLSTPFDRTSVDFLEKMRVSFYKIASFELVDIPLIEYVASKGKPVIISCGMGSPEEIQEAVDACSRQGNKQIILLKCCSEYPANASDMHLSVIADMKRRFHLPVGLSDHSMGSLAAVTAAALGACVIEKHFCIDRKIETPDSAFSMEPQEFSQMVQNVAAVHSMIGDISYERTAAEEQSIIFRRSLFAIADIAKGDILSEKNMRIIRPGYGMKPKYWKILYGKPARYDYKKGEPIQEEREDF